MQTHFRGSGHFSFLLFSNNFLSAKNQLVTALDFRPYCSITVAKVRTAPLGGRICRKVKLTVGQLRSQEREMRSIGKTQAVVDSKTSKSLVLPDPCSYSFNSKQRTRELA